MGTERGRREQTPPQLPLASSIPWLQKASPTRQRSEPSFLQISLRAAPQFCPNPGMVFDRQLIQGCLVINGPRYRKSLYLTAARVLSPCGNQSPAPTPCETMKHFWRHEGHLASHHQPHFKVTTSWSRELSLFIYKHLPQGLPLSQEPRNAHQYGFWLLSHWLISPGGDHGWNECYHRSINHSSL